MGVSEVSYGDRTIMSITDSTVTADTLADGAVAYGADGERIVGRMTMGLPVGHEWITMNPNIPTGCLPLLGGTYSRTAYADLWEWVQSQTGYLITEAEWQERSAANGGNVSCYSDGDGSTTFRVPSRSCWVKGANNIEEVGSYLEAGLPDHVHQSPYGLNDNGGYHNEGSSSPHPATPLKYSIKGYGYDSTLASESNPIYGNSDTVQPQSLVGMWLVKAFGTISNAGNQDIADISAGLTDISAGLTRVETRLSDTEGRTYLTETYSDGANWYRVWSDGWIEQGGRTSAKESTNMQVTFLKPFSTADYAVTVTDMFTSSTGNGWGYAHTLTTTGFNIVQTSGGAIWTACGY